jgi:hypothetical protein
MPEAPQRGAEVSATAWTAFPDEEADVRSYRASLSTGRMPDAVHKAPRSRERMNRPDAAEVRNVQSSQHATTRRCETDARTNIHSVRVSSAADRVAARGRSERGRAQWPRLRAARVRC